MLFRSPGDFVDIHGNVIGKHKGIIHYTIGQRKGLGLAMGHPVFVVDIIPETNQVVIGENGDVFSEKLVCNRLNFMSIEDLTDPMHVKAKIRYNHKGSMCMAQYRYRHGHHAEIRLGRGKSLL